MKDQEIGIDGLLAYVYAAGKAANFEDKQLYRMFTLIPHIIERYDFRDIDKIYRKFVERHN